MYIDMNLNKKYSSFKKLLVNEELSDRTEFLEHLNSILSTDERYVCIHALARTGKTVLANMIASYYSNTLNSKYYFDNANISKKFSYEEHLNQHNVIYIDMKCNRFFMGNYINYICKIEEKIIKSLIEQFPDLDISVNRSVFENLTSVYQLTGEKFIFIIDNWDYVFGIQRFSNENCVDYVNILLEMLSDEDYLELAYLTGKYPVTNYVKSHKLAHFNEFELTSYQNDFKAGASLMV